MFLVFPIIILPLFKPTTFPGHLRYASANLDLVLPVHKHNSLLTELRSAVLATIHERYSDQDWLHVFTDGSTTASFGRAGSGAFSNSFNLKEPLSAWSYNFDCEIYTIFMAFRAISATPGQNIVIFIDSQAIIKTVSGYNSVSQTVGHVSLGEACRQVGQRGFDAASTLRNAKRLLSDKFRQKRISTITDLAVDKSWSRLLDGQRRVSFLPYLEWRVWHVSESSSDNNNVRGTFGAHSPVGLKSPILEF
ncbi:uncharacterized protein LOC103524116 [Trichonephila clavipes]|nr:uncharacterized protein LOC103524116 [Trichonephila clavipes]